MTIRCGSVFGPTEAVAEEPKLSVVDDAEEREIPYWWLSNKFTLG